MELDRRAQRHTADTPPIMKSTRYKCQVSNQNPRQKQHTGRGGQRRKGYAPKKSLGDLTFFTSAILTEGKPKGGRKLSGGGRTSWKRKSLACERLSTFSDSAGISTPSPTDKAARQKFAGPITFRPSLRAMLAASRQPASPIIARRTASTLLRQALSSHTTSHLFQSRHPWRTLCKLRSSRNTTPSHYIAHWRTVPDYDNILRYNMRMMQPRTQENPSMTDQRNQRHKPRVTANSLVKSCRRRYRAVMYKAKAAECFGNCRAGM